MDKWKDNTYDTPVEAWCLGPDFANCDTFASFRPLAYAFDNLKGITFSMWIFVALRLCEIMLNLTPQTSTFYQVFVSTIKNIIVFLIIGGILVVIFGLGGWMLFSTEIKQFRTIRMALYNVIGAMWQGLPQEVTDFGKIGPWFGVLFWIFNGLFWLNLIIAILTEAWESVTEQQSLVENKDGTLQTWGQDD
eukprot:UN22677